MGRLCRVLHKELSVQSAGGLMSSGEELYRIGTSALTFSVLLWIALLDHRRRGMIREAPATEPAPVKD
ncbi:MAG: hypothetical protein E2O56_00395 [Gammaproteobacteria bacterium]|nr:MAG: hypothetical protein E2O56_00395 [Gammaproteobacteria bacterium]